MILNIIYAILISHLIMHAFTGKFKWWLKDTPEELSKKIKHLEIEISNLEGRIVLDMNLSRSEGKILTDRYFTLIKKKKKLEKILNSHK